jgi:hypothetical protein
MATGEIARSFLKSVITVTPYGVRSSAHALTKATLTANFTRCGHVCASHDQSSYGNVHDSSRDRDRQLMTHQVGVVADVSPVWPVFLVSLKDRSLAVMRDDGQK